MPTIPELRYKLDKYGPGIKALWRQGWTEIPTLLSSMPLLPISLIMVSIGLYRYNKYDLDNRQYRYWYTVYRPDDPRAEELRRFMLNVRRPNSAENGTYHHGFTQ